MKLRKVLAGIAAIFLGLGGLMIGGAAANAAAAAFPGGGYVPVSEIAVPNSPEEESLNYNTWHLSPSHKSGYSQAPNGVVVEAAGDTLIRLGNGNDGIEVLGEALNSNISIGELAQSLNVVSSNNAKVSLQIPIFYWVEEGGNQIRKYTSFRQNADAARNGVWTTSSAIPGFGANATASIQELTDALGENAYPIAAGFLVQNPGESVLVSSMKIGDTTTRFYSEPVVDRKTGTGQSAFVHSDDINPDESTYEGWHEGVAPEHPDLGSFVSLSDAGHYKGLEVTGKSQIIYGYEESGRPQNALPVILADSANGFTVTGVPSPSTGFEVQVPVFFYQEGVEGQQFTTLRAAIPADGRVTGDLPWASSRGFGNVEANAYVPLMEILNQMSSYEILAHGFTVETGTVLLKSVAFNGNVTAFATPEPTPAPTAPNAGQQELAATGATNGFIAVTGIALLAAAGALFLLRRIRLS